MSSPSRYEKEYFLVFYQREVSVLPVWHYLSQGSSRSYNHVSSSRNCTLEMNPRQPRAPDELFSSEV